MFEFLIKKNMVKVKNEYPMLIHLPQSYPININKNTEKIKSKFNFSKIFLKEKFPIQILKLSKYE